MNRCSLLCAPLLLAVFASAALAAGDAGEGRRLVQEKGCEACHQRKVPGEGAIYLRKDRKVTSLAKLHAQVASCNAQLKLGLFPEEEEHIASYLNATYYKFKAP